MAQLKKVPGVVLIDCPGNLNDRNLEYIYKNADTAIIPISFDPDTVDATGIFYKSPEKRIGSTTCVYTQPNYHFGEEIRRIEAEGPDNRIAWAGGNRHTYNKTKCRSETLYNIISTGKDSTGHR